MSSNAAETARCERYSSLLKVTLTEPLEPEPEPDALLAASTAALRSDVAVWRQQGETLLQRARHMVPTNDMLALPAAFGEIIDTLESQLAQAAALLAFEANPEALRCVLMWAVRVIDAFAHTLHVRADAFTYALDDGTVCLSVAGCVHDWSRSAGPPGMACRE